MSEGEAGPHPITRAVLAQAQAAGVTLMAQRFPDGTRTAQEAAAAVGVPVGAIVKSLLFMVGAEPWMVLTAGDRRVDEAALAGRTGQAVRRASAEEVRRWTGAAIGGVPPFAHPSPLPTLVDGSLWRYPEVWAAAGTPDSVVALTPDQLLALCAGEVWPDQG